MLRVAPGWDRDEVEELLAETISKEITASINVFPTTRLDYRCFFSNNPRHRYLPLAPNISPDPENAIDIHNRFRRLRRDLDQKVFFPDYSHKTCGKEVSEEFWKYYDLNPCFELDDQTGEVGKGKVSLIDLEKMWDRMGIRVGGAVELREAWRYNDLKPRAYFARGGSIHWVSRHIQSIVNIIIDEFPEVNRKDRFSAFEERFLDDSTSVLIYDYSSFTSNLEEMNRFIPELAEFFRGTVVKLYDIRDGLEEWDLGDYLEEYLLEANLIGRFLVSASISPELSSVEFRNTCGMLGVPGNIFLATLLHGLHLRIIAGVGRSKCVGDDAKAKVPAWHDPVSTSNVLSNLGAVHPDKTNWFVPHGNESLERYQYIKRPFYRSDVGTMISGHLIAFPSFVWMASDPDPYHTVPPLSDPPSTMLRALIRFMVQIYIIHEDLSEDDMRIAWTYAIEYRKKMVEWTKSQGNNFSKSLKLMGRNLIPDFHDFGQVEPRSWIIEQIPDGEKIEIPVPAYSSGDVCGYTGETFVRGGGRFLAYLEDLGYVSSKLEYFWASKLDLGSFFFEAYFGLYQYAKTYEILRPLPVHAILMLNPEM